MTVAAGAAAAVTGSVGCSVQPDQGSAQGEESGSHKLFPVKGRRWVLRRLLVTRNPAGKRAMHQND